ncbi:MAG: NADH-ubiquinone oxidoreductase-F iron-sulfur binding region domain-containing protein [Terracidiphilus sp.]|nr:NADH-ubiquinone oxidoreductase-F iron-sulfur binding region domain-containing protein [Terracidiphilus sp.]
MQLEELREIAEAEREAQKQFTRNIHVCVAAGCLSQRSDQLLNVLQTEVKNRGLDGSCKVKGVGCMGLCAAGPLIKCEPQHTYYRSLTPDHPEIVNAILDNLDSKPVPEFALSPELPFFAAQQKIVLENCGEIDPERIEEYIAVGGYEALLRAVTERSPDDVVQEVIRSGLRGRGGGGYPTGLKWSMVAKAGGSQKYVICNADEGDPGAFMDRSVLESDPHRVLEGMILAAYAVGASKGYIYCRAEYPLAVKRLKIAIRQAERLGLLGQRIGDSDFGFQIEIRLGAGAFVCGEETALIASVEGRRGVPRPRPPFPAYSGLYESATLLNNVETYANIAPILRNGGDWYASIGTEKSKGTKVFALVGDVCNTGLIEVAMGIKLRDLVFHLGGGMVGNHHFKAVQTGGPSGGCIPEQFLDMSVDYESLASVGSIMGSGGMIVMDDSACMVDVAKFFMDFTRDESCGKCIPCRVGTTQLHGLLERIAAGQGHMEDIGTLERLGRMVKRTALCGLGQTAPNPVSSTLRYFRDEYENHIRTRNCPQGRCACSKAQHSTAND